MKAGAGARLAGLRALLAAGRPADLSAWVPPDGLRILALGPHPDDVDAVGVTLRRLLRRGGVLKAAVVRTGSGIQAAYAPGANPAERAEIRTREQTASLRFFGLPEGALRFLDMEHDAQEHLLDSPANRAVLARELRAADADLVFLPHGCDSNRGHRMMAALYRRAARRLDREQASFGFRDPKTLRLRVDAYSSFGAEEAAWKAGLLRFHDSQQRRNLDQRGAGFDERILAVNRAAAAGLAAGPEFAETFEIDFHPARSGAEVAGRREIG